MRVRIFAAAVSQPVLGRRHCAPKAPSTTPRPAGGGSRSPTPHTGRKSQSLQRPPPPSCQPARINQQGRPAPRGAADEGESKGKPDIQPLPTLCRRSVVPRAPHRCGTVVRVLQPALRARLHSVDYQRPLDEWTEVFGSEWPIGTLLELLTHAHILGMSVERYRLKLSRENVALQAAEESDDP